MSDFKSFLVNNGVIASTAGITIGFATATFVKSLVADIVLPSIFLLISKGSGVVSKDGSFLTKFLAKKEYMFTNFISETITWIFIVLTAFFLLNFFYDHYIKNKPIISQETLSKPFSVAQEFFKMPQAPPPPPPPPKREYFNENEEEMHPQPLWGAPN